MHKAIEEIQMEFQKHGLKCGVEQKGDKWVLESIMSGRKGTGSDSEISGSDQQKLSWFANVCEGCESTFPYHCEVQGI